MSRHHSRESDTSYSNNNGYLPLDNMLKNINIGEILQNMDMKQLSSIVSSLKTIKDNKKAENDRKIEQRRRVEDVEESEVISIKKNKKEKMLQLVEDDDFKYSVITLISKFRGNQDVPIDITIFEDRELMSAIRILIEKVTSVY